MQAFHALLNNNTVITNNITHSNRIGRNELLFLIRITGSISLYIGS